jgi:hypothetical protein
MDLTLFIILLILAFMLYYLTSAVRSLVKEMREVKNKCIKVHKTNIEDFEVSTEDPGTQMKDKGIQILQNLKKVLG